jgi:4-hydroxy-tetrahydrodipicolinate reductase
MGKRLVHLGLMDGEFELVCAVEASGHAVIGKDAGAAAGCEKAGINVTETFCDGVDVVIDFSLPAAFDKVTDYCRDSKTSLVMGTTGLDDNQLGKVKELSGEIAVIQATNMSVGMNMLFNIVGKAARLLGDEYDVEIVEAHHRFKKDAPSGSALTLAENIAKDTGRDYPGCLDMGRSGKDCLREKGKIGMHAVRGGDITGEHSVIYSTVGESIRISHSAHSRDTFVVGALRAAKWLAGKKAGMYSMSEVLGL